MTAGSATSSSGALRPHRAGHAPGAGGYRPARSAPQLDDFVLAVDAPAGWNELHQLPASGVVRGERSTALGERYLAGIRSRVPDKPVRYIVLTHAHGDHAGGVPAFIESGATILGSDVTRPVVEGLMTRPGTLAGFDVTAGTWCTRRSTASG